ncbi:hypothetical protein [Lactovum odontotermitis]
MKNISLENQHLIVSGYAQGSAVTTFSLVFFLLFIFRWGTALGYFFLGLGIFLLIIGIWVYTRNSKKKYLEIEDGLMTIYPDGSDKMRYEVPLNRISYLTHLDKQKSTNTKVFATILNQKSDPCFWINGSLKEELSKSEIDLEYLPVRDKFLPEFTQLLEEQYGIFYKKRKTWKTP